VPERKSSQAARPQPAGDDEERRLLRRVVDRDRDALAELYCSYHPRLIRFVFRLVPNFTTAEELVNDTMLLVWQKAASFRGASRVSTWIFGIAYRITMRRMSRKRLILASLDNLEELAVEMQAPLEQSDWIRRGIDSLPDNQRAAVVLVFYLGLTYQEAADVAECPVNTIKTRMFHARRKLRILLDKHGTPVKEQL